MLRVSPPPNLAMPGLGTCLNSDSLPLIPCSNHFRPLTDSSDPSLLSCSVAETLISDPNCSSVDEDMPPYLRNTDQGDFPGGTNGILKVSVSRLSCGVIGRCREELDAQDLEGYVRDWKERRIDSGLPENRCFLPFLVGAKKMVECRVCLKSIYPGDGVSCSVRGCQSPYHHVCARDILRCSSLKTFKCPRHACFLCKRRQRLWRCIRCSLASNPECAAWPEGVLHLRSLSGSTVCWRHPKDWRIEKKSAVPTDSIEEIFCHLPLPYSEEEFKMVTTVRESTDNKDQPPKFTLIKRNVYMVKKKRDALFVDAGCNGCRLKCDADCECRSQCISCSKTCRCSAACTNRPFRKEKRVRLVKTEHCGWGLEAAEDIKKGEFIIEYTGEVIDDAMCEDRLWSMKYAGDKNFYMCEIHKDFIIDATFKGNMSRFLNHSCEPNCEMDKWQVEGETRVGVFAAQFIKAGEPLTYDYRFVQFGPEVKCLCGSAKCRGYLGDKKKEETASKSTKKKEKTASKSTKKKENTASNSGHKVKIQENHGLGDIHWGKKAKRTRTIPAAVAKP